MDAEHKLDDHLHLSGLPENFALLIDAHLEAEGKRVPIHKSLLAVASPVFSNLFLSASNSNKSEDCFPMLGHTVADICTILKFLYKRTATMATETPSYGLWKSVEDATPIIRFLHKFDMQIILQECDEFLSIAAADSKGIFKDTNSTVAWAALADDCGLRRLLAKAEHFMISNASPAFWRSHAFNRHKLSSSCMLRMLQAVQPNMKKNITASSPQGPPKIEVRQPAVRQSAVRQPTVGQPDPDRILYFKTAGAARSCSVHSVPHKRTQSFTCKGLAQG